MDFRKAIRNGNIAQLGFILAELSTGMTFASIAHHDSEPEAKARHRTIACAAYSSAAHFVDCVAMTREQSHEVRTTMTSLKQELQTLGERF